MFLLLALYYLAPVKGVKSLSTSVTDDPTSATCGDTSDCRSMWEIIWGCLATIVACTWVAIHPNVPALNDTSLRIALRRTGLVLISLIAPELVVVWALRQWLVAHRLSREYKGNVDSHWQIENYLLIFQHIQTTDGRWLMDFSL